MLKPYLLATMDDSPDEVKAFRDVLVHRGKFIYPLKSKLSAESRDWSTELLVYVKGANFVKYRADIIYPEKAGLTGDEIEFPQILKPILRKYDSFFMLSSFDAIVSYDWRELVDENRRPKKNMPQSAPHRVYADSNKIIKRSI